MSEREHTSKHYEQQLRLLKEKLLLIGHKAETSIADATRALVELLTYMFEDPTTISRALRLMFVARNLERVGDHASNIAEMVIFLVEGQDIRHTQAAKSASVT